MSEIMYLQVEVSEHGLIYCDGQYIGMRSNKEKYLISHDRVIEYD